MQNTEAVQDLKTIKDIMERSVRFSSLSGLSGILAGCYACIGAYLGYKLIYVDNTRLGYRELYINDGHVLYQLTVIALVVFALSVTTGFIFTYRKAKKDRRKLWDKSAKLTMANFMVPFVTGALFILAMFMRGHYGMVAPATLIVYGISLFSASKYTPPEIRLLGIVQCTLGVLCSFIPGYGIVFWTLGFGVAHIVYGWIMYRKYEA